MLVMPSCVAKKKRLQSVIITVVNDSIFYLLQLASWIVKEVVIGFHYGTDYFI